MAAGAMARMFPCPRQPVLPPHGHALSFKIKAIPCMGTFGTDYIHAPFAYASRLPTLSAAGPGPERQDVLPPLP